MPPTNTDLDHHEYQEMLGAYALGALDERERQAIEGHLHTCSTCRDELARLLLAVGELPLLADEAEPSAGLREHIRQAALREPREQGTADHNGARTEPAPLRPTKRQAEQRASGAWIPWLVAAALLLTVAGLLIWNLQLRGETSNQAIETFALQPQGGASVSGELIYIADRHIGVLKTESLPPLQPGQVYQMWLIKDGRPVGAGTFTAPTGDVAIDLDRTQYQVFALTREPGPNGSAAPTSDPFAIVPLGES